MLCRETELLHRTLKLFGLPLRMPLPRRERPAPPARRLLGHTIHLRNGNPDPGNAFVFAPPQRLTQSAS